MNTVAAWVALTIVLDPVGTVDVSRTQAGDRTTIVRQCAIAAVALVIAALAGHALTDAASLSRQTIEVASAVMVAVGGVWLFVRGDQRGLLPPEPRGKAVVVPVVVPLLVGPVPVLAAMAMAVDRGTGAAVVAAVGAACVVAGYGLAAPAAIARWQWLLGRVSGVLMVAVAARLAERAIIAL